MGLWDAPVVVGRQQIVSEGKGMGETETEVKAVAATHLPRADDTTETVNETAAGQIAIEDTDHAGSKVPAKGGTTVGGRELVSLAATVFYRSQSVQVEPRESALKDEAERVAGSHNHTARKEDSFEVAKVEIAQPFEGGELVNVKQSEETGKRSQHRILGTL